jgi:cysteine synthase
MQAEVENAKEQIQRQNGKLEAFNQFQNYTDPAKYCQVCGHEYWGGDREKHELSHVPSADGHVDK